MGGKSKSLLLDALVVCSYFIRDNEDVVFISGYSPGSSSSKRKKKCVHTKQEYPVYLIYAVNTLTCMRRPVITVVKELLCELQYYACLAVTVVVLYSS